MLISYLSWHYGAGMVEAWDRARLAMYAVYNYFSIKQLFGSLFAPFHRDLPQRRLGFDPKVFFYSIAENLVSRVIGFLIRAVILFLGLFAMFFTVLGSLLFYLGWLVAPVSAVLFVLIGFVMFF